MQGASGLDGEARKGAHQKLNSKSARPKAQRQGSEQGHQGRIHHPAKVADESLQTRCPETPERKGQAVGASGSEKGKAPRGSTKAGDSGRVLWLPRVPRSATFGLGLTGIVLFARG